MESKDNRIKLNTANSELLANLADKTGADPQDILAECLAKKSNNLLVNELDLPDQACFRKLSKYIDAIPDIFVELCREKNIDKDQLCQAHANERRSDQATIKELTISNEEMRKRIIILDDELKKRDERIKELEDSSKNAQKYEEFMEKIANKLAIDTPKNKAKNT